MKAAALFVAFLAVVLFFNSPIDTAEQAAEGMGISPFLAIGGILLAGLLFLMRGSRTPNGR